MFGLEWSKHKSSVNEIDGIKHSKDIIDNVVFVSPLMWGEHCLECAVPECYHTCPKFEARDDGRCRRFENGIEKINTRSGLWGYTAKISFREWGKLEAVFVPHQVSVKKAIVLNSIFDFTTRMSKLLPTKYPRRLNYLCKEYITRKLGKGKGSLPEIFLAEILNPGDKYNLVLETKTDETTLSRHSLEINPGFNRYIIPFCELNYQEGTNNYISLYPENDLQVDIYIDSLDLVTLDRAVTECVEMPKIKCVVWDLDNTIWSGILSEDNSVQLRGEAVDIIKELDRRGILNSIASKNNMTEAVEKLSDFGILDYFLCPQINWGMKSDSVRNISKILDIGIDTIAFIDDMEFERSEVEHSIPMVRVFDANNLNSLITNTGVDVPVTEAALIRRQSYREIAERNADLARYQGDLEGFVRNCEIKVLLETPRDMDFGRCNELIQRTNQLNLSGKRLSFEEMKELFTRSNVLSQSIRVSDKFGDYGLVGLAIFSIDNDKKKAELNHFVLSCRAARKLIEQSYFEYMISYLETVGIEKLVVHCAITPKNSLLRNSISEICGDEKHVIDNMHYDLIINCKEHKRKYNDLMFFEYKNKVV